jgi:nitroreductase
MKAETEEMNMEFITLAKERYSCRKLSDRKVDRELTDRIAEAGLSAPTACNYQPFRIWVMESEDALNRIRSCTRQQFAAAAPVVFVVGACREEGWVREYDQKNFAEIDAAIAATHMMLEVQDLGLGTTWIGHFDVNAACEQFPEMKGYELIAMFAVGWPADDAVPAASHEKSRGEELVHRL